MSSIKEPRRNDERMTHAEMSKSRKWLSHIDLRECGAMVMLPMEPWKMGCQMDAIIVDGLRHFQT